MFLQQRAKLVKVIIVNKFSEMKAVIGQTGNNKKEYIFFLSQTNILFRNNRQTVSVKVTKSK